MRSSLPSKSRRLEVSQEAMTWEEVDALVERLRKRGRLLAWTCLIPFLIFIIGAVFESMLTLFFSIVIIAVYGIFSIRIDSSRIRAANKYAPLIENAVKQRYGIDVSSVDVPRNRVRYTRDNDPYTTTFVRRPDDTIDLLTETKTKTTSPVPPKS